MLRLEELAELLEQNRAAAQARVKEFSIGGRHFPFNSRPAIMGVINLSADSWYRESVCLTAESAVRRGKVMPAQGADIVDVGAESTLAHAARVDEAGQNSKLLPVIRAVAGVGHPGFGRDLPARRHPRLSGSRSERPQSHRHRPATMNCSAWSPRTMQR